MLGSDIRALLGQGLARLGYRRLHLFAYPLEAHSSDRPDALVELLREEDVEDYLAFRPDTPEASIRGRLAEGDRCFVIRQDGRLVHAAWLACRPVWNRYLGRHIPLEPGDAYIYDAFTAPDMRGRGLGRARHAAMVHELRSEGRSRSVAVVLPHNRAGVRFVVKNGYRRIGVLRAFSRGYFRRG